MVAAYEAVGEFSVFLLIDFLMSVQCTLHTQLVNLIFDLDWEPGVVGDLINFE